MISRLRTKLSHFRRDEAGLLTLETMLMLPLLFWVFIATFAFFDVFRAQTVTMNATYTISDLISREWEGVDDNYLTQMHRLQNYLTYSQTESQLRVTIVCWSDKKKKYRVAWSSTHGSQFLKKHNNSSIEAQKDKLPTFPEGEQLILVESWVDYQPPLNVGIAADTHYNYVFTRPRFTAQIKLNDDDSLVCSG